MKLDPTDLAVLLTMVIFTIVLAIRDDPRPWRWFCGAFKKMITMPLRRSKNWHEIAKRRNAWSGHAHSSCRRGTTEAVP